MDGVPLGERQGAAQSLNQNRCREVWERVEDRRSQTAPSRPKEHQKSGERPGLSRHTCLLRAKDPCQVPRWVLLLSRLSVRQGQSGCARNVRSVQGKGRKVPSPASGARGAKEPMQKSEQK